MGRPTKEENIKRTKIVNLELIKRNNFIYNVFEEQCDFLDNSYLFALECLARETSKNRKTQPYKYWSSVREKPYIEELDKLKNIDFELFNYYSSLISYSLQSKSRNKKDYTVRTEADANFIKKALGEQRFNEINFYGKIYGEQGSYIVDGKGSPISNFQNRLHYMEDTDIQKIKESIQEKNNPSSSFFKTIISRPIYSGGLNNHPIKKNTYFIELDLTKSKKTLTNFIENIKDDYDKSSENFPNHYDLFNIKINEFKCEFESCIDKTNQSKQLHELLADILFIYDCKIANFDYTIINQEFKEYYKQGIKRDTVRIYYDIACTFIDEMKYKSFLTGLE